MHVIHSDSFGIAPFGSIASNHHILVLISLLFDKDVRVNCRTYCVTSRQCLKACQQQFPPVQLARGGGGGYVVCDHEHFMNK